MTENERNIIILQLIIKRTNELISEIKAADHKVNHVPWDVWDLREEIEEIINSIFENYEKLQGFE